jgi:hypothetical protein
LAKTKKLQPLVLGVELADDDLLQIVGGIGSDDAGASTCPVCGKDVCSISLTAHMLSAHSGSTPCPECGKEMLGFLLVEHLTNEHGWTDL